MDKPSESLREFQEQDAEPELTLGTSKHADPSFLTVLMQDEIAGLQVLHENQRVDVPPIRGGFLVNIRNFLQLVSNDKFKSNKHRVLANRIGPRISVPCFLYGPVPSCKLYGLIKELISEGNPTLYREVQLDKYIAKFLSTGLDEYQELISNDQLKSNKHRVLASRVGPRISVACFLSGPVLSSKVYGPINELISEGNPPVYREVQLGEYAAKFASTGVDEDRRLDYYKR
ncbi:hypothetical protein RJ640_001522 [Escallonia rubra]|uniref:Fe2OG dioxygenase domain-containing protein n=1 Tax=Escallonia rubra TaxID=112253 RepID=A0AA88QB95_9ASTE|nr:hypothetical protein RJ640_001522 [Escallonia rubra]